MDDIAIHTKKQPNETEEQHQQRHKKYTHHILDKLDDTILTPFSVSPMTDTVVDSLPTLFLAYCTLADSDDILSINDQVAPRGSASDPVPLLTDCAFGLRPSFLSRSRQ
jgi:hypothetical protein